MEAVTMPVNAVAAGIAAPIGTSYGLVKGLFGAVIPGAEPNAGAENGSVRRRSVSVEEELNYKKELVKRHMGSMAQCRGKHGDILREAGAVEALLTALGGLIDGTWEVLLPKFCSSKEGMSPLNAIGDASIDLSTVCFGALRDLACGSAENRSAIHSFSYHGCPFDVWSTSHTNQMETAAVARQGGGLCIFSRYLERYHMFTWNDILCLHETNPALHIRGKKELRLLTNVVGAMRNATHSTPITCNAFHELSVTDMIIWRLKYGEGIVKNGSLDFGEVRQSICLPDVSKPWREACYRIAGSLINMSEKCDACADRCGMDIDLVYLLVEAWGGKIDDSASTPPLHLGLAKVLRSAEKASGGLDKTLLRILEREEERRRTAQAREKKRKELLQQRRPIA